MLQSKTTALRQSPGIDLLRVVTCGSVDDGKSTLIGRLLYDLHALTDEQLREIRGDGITGPDFSLALDGLAAEREQGITIDVAYRSFSSPRRRFLIADVPGHEQYTRNMVTGASTADVALLVINVTSGLLTQMRRHTYLAWLLGIRQFILAVNKMDLIDFDPMMFHQITNEYRHFFGHLAQSECHPIPICARLGHNIVQRSGDTAWFSGPTLSEALHTARARNERETCPLRLPVQWVNRSFETGRGYSGTVAAGRVAVGDPIEIQPSKQRANVAEILTPEGPSTEAFAGEAITIRLDKDIDLGRGHLICSTEAPPPLADLLHATIIWMSNAPLVRGRSYRLKLGTKVVAGQILLIGSKIDPDTLSPVNTETLSQSEIGTCSVMLDEPVAFDLYEQNRETGGFILIDRVSNDTAAAGLIQSGELRFRNIPWQALEVTKNSRAALKNHPPAVVWFTGIPGAGKSTIANIVERMLHRKGWHTYLLDGDNIRHGLTRDLGFSDADRVENVRRTAEVARLMADAGLIVLVALISPFSADRRSARERIGEEFIEVFVDTPLDVAEGRDVKGQYKRARTGELSDFTGIGSSYERPETPEVHIHTSGVSPEEAAQQVITYLAHWCGARK